MSVRSAPRYPVGMRAIHWLGVALIAVAYLTSEWAEEDGGGGVDWHVLAGLALLLLFLPRLLARWLGRMPPSTASGMSVRVARLTHVALLLFMLVQPLLGVLAVWSEGHALAIPLTPWQLPPLLTFGESGGEWLGELHETVGNVFYGVIGLHVLAVVWHLARRDGALRRMW